MARGQQDIALILLRDLAEKLATPMFITDEHGHLVFYNEAAEAILGRKFSDRYTRALLPEQWTQLLRPVDLDGRELALDEVAPGIALLERRPSHQRLQISALDGSQRIVSATAFPLFTRSDTFVGMLSIFWEEPVEPPQ